MNKSRAIWGVICLVIAGVLGVLYFVLPPEDLMFTVGDQNLPWVPAVILGVVGLILLASSVTTSTIEDQESEKPEARRDPEKAALNKRMETICWGLFLIMLGCFMFVPEEIISGGIWPIGVGLIMLGLNVTRYFMGIKMSGFTTALGIISVVGGILELAGWTNLEGGILLVILGAYLLFKPWFEKRQLFGKAETS